MADDERADDGTQPDPDGSEASADPRSDTEQAVDSMEQRVLGDDAAAALNDKARNDEDGQTDRSPAFEQDLDPADQSSADAGAENSG